MKIGVMSDTHGDRRAMLRVLESAGEVEMWIHLGDYRRDAAFLEERGLEVCAVAGNCDWSGEDEFVLAVNGARLFITHGHLYGARYSVDKLLYRAEELECTAVLFGHTHIQLISDEDGILLLNPGSPSQPRGGSRAGFALLNVEEDGRLWAELKEV